MKKEKNNCAFQYYNGLIVVEDAYELTLTEAKELLNEWYDDIVNRVSSEPDYASNIEVALWINMKDKDTYKDTMLHWRGSELRVDGGQLYLSQPINKFNL